MTLEELYLKAEGENIEIDDFPMRELISVSFPENWIVIDTRRIKTRKEEKVLLAHEIAHCETGSFYNIYSPYDIKGKYEYKAKKRSYQMLVPHEQLIEAIKKGIVEMRELAEYFDVPYDFMVKAVEYWQQVEMAG